MRAIEGGAVERPQHGVVAPHRQGAGATARATRRAPRRAVDGRRASNASPEQIGVPDWESLYQRIRAWRSPEDGGQLSSTVNHITVGARSPVASRYSVPGSPRADERHRSAGDLVDRRVTRRSTSRRARFEVTTGGVNGRLLRPRGRRRTGRSDPTLPSPSGARSSSSTRRTSGRPRGSTVPPDTEWMFGLARPPCAWRSWSCSSPARRRSGCGRCRARPRPSAERAGAAPGRALTEAAQLVPARRDRRLRPPVGVGRRVAVRGGDVSMVPSGARGEVPSPFRARLELDARAAAGSRACRRPGSPSCRASVSGRCGPSRPAPWSGRSTSRCAGSPRCWPTARATQQRLRRAVDGDECRAHARARSGFPDWESLYQRHARAQARRTVAGCRRWCATPRSARTGCR